MNADEIRRQRALARDAAGLKWGVAVEMRGRRPGVWTPILLDDVRSGPVRDCLERIEEEAQALAQGYLDKQLTLLPDRVDALIQDELDAAQAAMEDEDG